MSQPLASVITGFLNEKRFLAEAIESVLAQDMPDWELILIDDGSTDESTSIARQYAQQYPGKIIYCEHEGHVNKGVSASRNHGIYQARGKFLAFLDADDVWQPDKLSAQLAIFQQYPDIALLAEASLYWYRWNAPESEDVLIPVGAPAGRVYQPGELLSLLYPLAAAAAPCPSGLMVTRQACLAVGAFEESFTGNYQLYEDQAFLGKIYTKEKVYISAACHHFYRQHADSCVQVVKGNGHYHPIRKYYLEWFAAYLHNEHITDKKIIELLKSALLPYRRPTLYYLKHSIINRMANKMLRIINS